MPCQFLASSLLLLLDKIIDYRGGLLEVVDE